MDFITRFFRAFFRSVKGENLDLIQDLVYYKNRVKEYNDYLSDANKNIKELVLAHNKFETQIAEMKSLLINKDLTISGLNKEIDHLNRNIDAQKFLLDYYGTIIYIPLLPGNIPGTNNCFSAN